jgi:hypothetical protein
MSKGQTLVSKPLSRRSLCRNWHLARCAGCRASQGRLPPPLLIRQSYSVVEQECNDLCRECQDAIAPNGRARFRFEQTPLGSSPRNPDNRVMANAAERKKSRPCEGAALRDSLIESTVLKFRPGPRRRLSPRSVCSAGVTPLRARFHRGAGWLHRPEDHGA